MEDAVGDLVIEELTFQPDDTLLGVTVSVLGDGRIRIETDEAQWTLPLSGSRAIATAALQAMGPVDQPGGDGEPAAEIETMSR